jgi:uncharacterized protein involved in outer membrane biogenesis
MRLIIFGLSFLALLLMAALVGPSFVDWNKYKPQIIAQVEKATGLDVQIGGDMSMAVLPTPRVKIEDLTVVAPRKIEFENLLTMKSAEVSVELLPLFSKKIVVDSVTLVEPNIQVEIMADGTPSWETEKIARMTNKSGNVSPQNEANNNQPDANNTAQTSAQTSGKAMDAITLNELTIEGGTLSFINHQNKMSHKVRDMDVALRANSLSGPFSAEGELTYNDKRITIDAETGKIPQDEGTMDVQADLGLPDTGAQLTFSGVAAVKEPYDVQGKTTLKADSVQKLAAQFNKQLGKEYDQSIMMDGLLSADQDSITYNDLKFSFGDFLANGKFSVENLKARNPVRVTGNLKSSSVLNLNPFLNAPKKRETALNNKSLIKKAVAQSTAPAKTLIPDTLTLPMPVNVAVKLDMGGVRAQDHVVKGVFVDVMKSGSKAGITFKTLELPGQGKANGIIDIVYGSSSISSKTGQVVYSDPMVSYNVEGNVGQLQPFLNAFAPDVDTKVITKLYNTAQFDLKGNVRSNLISMNDSVLKLDDMVLGIGGKYEPARAGKRPEATIDISAGTVDFDRITAAQGRKTATANNNSNNSSTAPPSEKIKESLKPVQGLSLPMDLGFDVSIQQARLNNADVKGIRLTGALVGNTLTFKNASVNDYAGATMTLKGGVNDLSKLSGIDLELGVRTSDAKKLAQAFKVDTSKFPADLNSLDATVAGKGKIDSLTFSCNVQALGGQLDASGLATNALENPSFSNMQIRVQHPNLVKAVQIVSPGFNSTDALQQRVDFYTRAEKENKRYILREIKAAVGATSFGGNLIVDTDTSVPVIRGSIAANDIDLNKLLKVKTGGGSTSSAAPSTPEKTAAANNTTGGRWSTIPINFDWMNKVDLNVDLAADSIIYGNWNFINPKTVLKVVDGKLAMTDMKAGLFGGQASLNTEVNSKPVSVKVDSRMDNVNLEQLVRAISRSRRLQSAGNVSFVMEIAATGNTMAALVSDVDGTASAGGENIILKGFDLAKLARGLAVEEKLATSALSVVQGAISSGQTQFDTAKGSYKITDGVAKIQSMVMDGPAATIRTTGYADFPKWYVNLDNEITLKEVPDLQPFSVKMKGPLDSPTDTFGKNIIEDYVMDKIRRKVGKELPGLLGSDVSEKLKQFGILPQQQQQQAPADTTTPQESTTDGTSSDGTSTEGTRQQQPQQQQEKAPLQKLLENPEDKDAIKGVIDGFLR